MPAAESALAERRPVGPLDELRAGVAALTRVPIAGVRGDVSGAPAFGLVGAAIGVAGLVPLVLLGGLVPAPAVVLSLAAIAIVSGALHLDGLADTADALLATGPAAAERARKDPSLGVGGGVALLVVLGLDAASLDLILRLAGPVVAGSVVVAAGATSRAMAVAVAFGGRRWAETGTGMGARFAAAMTMARTTVAMVTAAAIAGIAGLASGAVAVPLGAAAGAALGAGAIAAVIRARHQLDGDGSAPRSS